MSDTLRPGSLGRGRRPLALAAAGSVLMAGVMAPVAPARAQSAGERPEDTTVAAAKDRKPVRGRLDRQIRGWAVLGPGHAIRGARVSLESLGGKPLCAEAGCGEVRTSRSGIFMVERDRHMPRRFVVEVAGGQVRGKPFRGVLHGLVDRHSQTDAMAATPITSLLVTAMRAGLAPRVAERRVLRVLDLPTGIHPEHDARLNSRVVSGRKVMALAGKEGSWRALQADLTSRVVNHGKPISLGKSSGSVKERGPVRASSRTGDGQVTANIVGALSAASFVVGLISGTDNWLWKKEFNASLAATLQQAQDANKRLSAVSLEILGQLDQVRDESLRASLDQATQAFAPLIQEVTAAETNLEFTAQQVLDAQKQTDPLAALIAMSAASTGLKDWFAKTQQVLIDGVPGIRGKKTAEAVAGQVQQAILPAADALHREMSRDGNWFDPRAVLAYYQQVLGMVERSTVGYYQGRAMQSVMSGFTSANPGPQDQNGLSQLQAAVTTYGAAALADPIGFPTTCKLPTAKSYGQYACAPAQPASPLSVDAYVRQIGGAQAPVQVTRQLCPSDTDAMRQGAYLPSVDRKFVVVVQTDGNVVLYPWSDSEKAPTGPALQATSLQTGGVGDRFVFQRDGNLVLYGGAIPAWAYSQLNGGATLSDADFVITTFDGDMVAYAWKKQLKVWKPFWSWRRGADVSNAIPQTISDARAWSGPSAAYRDTVNQPVCWGQPSYSIN